jgi:hypothetical protein
MINREENTMPDPSFVHNFGQIGRAYPDTVNLRFSFKAGTGEQSMQSQNGYYFIPANSGNYQVMAQLVFLSAEHGWTLHAQTADALIGGHAQVLYLVVDF